MNKRNIIGASVLAVGTAAVLAVTVPASASTHTAC